MVLSLLKRHMAGIKIVNIFPSDVKVIVICVKDELCTIDGNNKI